MPRSGPKQTVVDEQIVLDGIKYVRAIFKDLTRLCFDDDVSSKDVAKSIRDDMRVKLPVPKIFAALKVLHRCNAYIGIVAAARDQDATPRFPTSKTAVDHTIAMLVRKWISHVELSASVEADWREAGWNPVDLVHETLKRVVDYNTKYFFATRFENSSG